MNSLFKNQKPNSLKNSLDSIGDKTQNRDWTEDSW